VSAAARIRVSWTKNGSVTDTSDVNFAVASRIKVANPSGLPWGGGSTRTITWTHDYGAAQVFDLDFSGDNGATWTRVASGVQATTATTGSYTGPMPTTVTTQGMMRVSPAGAATDGDVNNTPITIEAPRVTVTAPNTNVNWAIGSAHNVTWTHNLGLAESTRIEVSADGGATWTLVANVALNTANASGTFNWTVAGSPTAAARIRVSWAGHAEVQDVSDVNFRTH
jgi:hypothetical protein